MVNYGFYKDTYLGSRIPEAAFPALAGKAMAYLRQLERVRPMTGGEDSRAMALCAMAEVLYGYEKHPDVKSTHIGGVSVTYEKSQMPLKRALWAAAGTYLEGYRGVGV